MPYGNITATRATTDQYTGQPLVVISSKCKVEVSCQVAAVDDCTCSSLPRSQLADMCSNYHKLDNKPEIRFPIQTTRSQMLLLWQLFVMVDEHTKQGTSVFQHSLNRTVLSTMSTRQSQMD